MRRIALGARIEMAMAARATQIVTPRTSFMLWPCRAFFARS